MQARDGLREWLVKAVAEKIGVAPYAIDDARTVADLGLSSTKAVEIAAQVKEVFGLDVGPAVLYDYPTIAELVAHLERQRDRTVSAGMDARVPLAEPIAIVGIGCRFPGCEAGPRAFIEMLKQGRNAITEVDPARWSAADFYSTDPEAPGKAATKWGGFLDGIDLFDPDAFGTAANEASVMDPQQRLLLEASTHAIEDAGYALGQLAETRTGVFVGISRNEYAHTRSLPPDNPLTAPGSALSIAANRISYLHNLLGPSVAVDTACSSSLMAIHLACRSLISGEADLALAGGVNVVLSPDVSIAFTKAGLMAPDGRCKPFSAAADGYVRGEGVGIVTLQRLSDALRERKRIYALIRGTAVVQDGKSNGLMAPRGTSQERVILEACREANIAPSALDYIETHGTGTKLGDVIEATAIGSVMKNRVPRQAPCVLGSVKSNIGHLEAAAGVAALIKTALCLHHKVLVPTLHFVRPNEAIDFERAGLSVGTQTREWPRREGGRSAGVSSFGFGGTNVHAVLTELNGVMPEVSKEEEAPVPPLLALSAHQPESLRALVGSYIRHIEEIADGETETYQALLRGSFARTERRYRLAVAAASRDRALGALRAWLAGVDDPGVHAGEGGRPGKVAFVFSGQGGQWTEAGRALFGTHPTYRSALLRCDDALRPYLGRSILEILFSDGASQLLTKTENIQPALFATQVAQVELLRSWHITPDMCVGHSVGEVAAAWAAGALTLDCAARLVVLRARATEEPAGKGCMAVIRTDAARVQALLDAHGSSATIAAINSRQSTVISGAYAEIDEAIRLAGEQGLSARRLPIDYAFHSRQMAPAAEAFRQAFGDAELGQWRVPFFSTVTGALHDGAVDVDYWCENIVRPVRFAAAVAAVSELGATAFIELGPGSLLKSDLIAETAETPRPTCVVSLLRQGTDSATTLAEAVGSLFAKGQVSLNRLVFRAPDRVPPYPWTHSRHWIAAGESERSAASQRRSGLRDPIAMACESGKRLWPGAIDLRASPRLLDHRVVGESVLPATAHLALLLEPTRGETHQGTLRDLQIERPLPLAEQDLVDIQVIEEAPANGSSALTLFASRSGPQPASWEKLSSATWMRSATAPIDSIQLDAVRARCLDQYPGILFYGLLARRGLTYGPAFRLLDQVVGRKGEALGRLGAGATDLLQPEVLDACLHVIAAALGARELGGTQSGFLLPQGIERVNIARHGVPRWSYCRVTNVTEDMLKADVLVLDDQGATLAELSGVRLSGSRQTVEQEQRHRRLLDWLYRIDWVEKANSGVANARADGDRCLILCDRGGWGDALADDLDALGLKCVRVERGLCFDQRGAGRYVVCADGPADLRRVIRQYGNESWRFVFYCWGLDSTGVESPIGDLTMQPRALLSLVQAVATESMRGKITLAIVTRRAVAPATAQSADPLQSMLWGLARTVMFEHPDLDCRCIDIDPDVPTEHAVETVLTEVARADRDNAIAYRGGKRFVRRLHRHRLANGPAELAAHGTYIVTGGLGALGLEAARTLASMGAHRILLVSRRQPTTEQQEELSALRADHRGIDYRLVDVTDFDAVAELIRTEHAQSPVRGIVHAAGVLSDAALVNTSAAQLEEVLRPKVLGALALHRAVANISLDFFVLFSSVASVLGSPGQASYCAANAFLDALAEHRARAGQRTVSISWSGWASKGMAARTAASASLAASRLVNMMPVSDGMELFRFLVASGDPHLLVLPFNVRSLLQFYPSNAGIALFDEIVAGTMTSIRSDGAAESVRQRPPLEVEYVAPHTEVQGAIVGIWQSALGMSGIGIRDELFSLGADSVFATQIVAQVNRRFGVRLGLDDAFATFTVEHLAERVEDELLRRVQEMDDAQVALAAADPGAAARADAVGA